MDIEKWMQKIPAWIKKYKYSLVAVLVGVAILLLPGRKAAVEEITVLTEETPQKDMAQELSALLSKIEGVGKVEVMLTIRSGETTYYQRDEDISSNGDSSSVRQETIVLTDSERNEHPLITQVRPPQYLGAVIVCQGADQPSVKWAIVEAVSKATGLGADQITVLKMK